MSLDSCVIIGAGHAGVQAAVSLRDFGWQGPIRLINDEDRLPYERPPLSKTFDGERGIVPLRPQAFYDDKDIELVQGQAVVSITPDKDCLTLADGSHIPYGHAIVATGSGPLRVPPFADPKTKRVYILRNAPDEAALRHALETQTLKSLLIVGAGFIGLETAAALAARVESIRVVDLAPAAMVRGVAPQIAAMCVTQLQAAGVNVQFETKIDAMTATDDGLELRLSNGEQTKVDGVLLSVGATPNDALLVNAGLCEHRNLLVNGQMQVGEHKNLYAVGDMVMAPHPMLGPTPMRLESVDVAVFQAKTAAAHICSAPPPKAQAPWFWSTQGQNKLLMVGIKSMATQWVVRTLEPSANGGLPVASTLGFDAQNRLVAAHCLNNAKDFAAARKFWGSVPTADVNALSDAAFGLKEAFSV